MSARAPFSWLNDVSRQFLGKDYLLAGTTPEARVQAIGTTAERILELPGFATKFVDYMSRGWISLSSPVWTNFGLDRGLPISCVVGDTWINTRYGGGKQARDIKIGDEVLTHRGRYRPVTDVMVTERRSDIHRLKVTGRMTNLYLTGDHLVLTNLGWVRTDQLNPMVHLVATNRVVEHEGRTRKVLATTKYVYTINFGVGALSGSRHRGNATIPFSDGLGYAPIRTIERTDRVETVYDFTVAEDHSFSASGVILHNCFGSRLSDSMESILDTHVEIGMMSKYGGGTSVYMGDLRGRGAPIRDNGTSAGSVHFAQLYDLEIQIVSQGNSRRGQCAAYWPIDHADIEEVLKIRTPGHPIQTLSYGVTVRDAWLHAMIDGDEAKRAVWAKVIAARKQTGYPYVVFIDTVNNAAPAEYKALGKTIWHSNLCVTGDQRVVSNRGLKTAKELYEEGGALRLFDNDKEVAASPMRLVERDVPVYRITLDNGMTHDTTAYHQVQVRTSGSGKPLKVADRRCDQLQPGDLVAVQTTKGLFGKTHMPEEAFLLGLYNGDGTQTDSLVAIDVWEDDFDLIDEIQTKYDSVVSRHNLSYSTARNRSYSTPTFHDGTPTEGGVRKKRLIGTALKKFGFRKHVIPDWIWTGDEETVWQYVRGVLYTDGTVEVGKAAGNPLQLSVSSVNHEYLRELQLLFANLGLTSAIYLLREAGPTMLPNGRGGTSAYQCQTCWRLVVGNKNDALTVERNTGFVTRRGKHIGDRVYRDNTKKFRGVVSVEPIGTQDVYCCTVESDSRHWVCNGVVTHNCSEIYLSNDEHESFVCCLSSMNDLYFDEWNNTDAVETMVYFLDAVMTEFIAKARDLHGMGRAVRFAERQRALGLGQLGWHSYLQSHMVPFESTEAKRHNVRIAKAVRDQALAASQKMARAYGEPEDLKGSGRRHMTLTAIAPTQSSSAILGQASEGIEPMASNYTIKDKQKLKYTYRNPYLRAVLAARGSDDEATWESVLKNNGSVQHLTVLSDHERAVFKTFLEISPMEVVTQAAQRQPYVCQGQSLNLMIDPSVSTKDVNRLLLEGWRMGVKGYYYQKNVNAAQQLTRDILTCSSCEG